MDNITKTKPRLAGAFQRGENGFVERGEMNAAYKRKLEAAYIMLVEAEKMLVTDYGNLERCLSLLKTEIEWLEEVNELGKGNL